jgi:hypothetical protein
VGWKGREWNARTGLAVHGTTTAQNTYRAHVEGSIGLIMLIAVRSSPWCIFILHSHVFSCRYIHVYVQTTIRHVPLTGVVLSSTYSCSHGKQIIHAVSAKIQCYNSPVPNSLPRPRDPIDNGQITLSWLLAPGTPAATLQSHPRLRWFLHFAAQHGWPMPTWSQSASSESHPPAVDRFFLRRPLLSSPDRIDYLLT